MLADPPGVSFDQGQVDRSRRAARCDPCAAPEQVAD